MLDSICEYIKYKLYIDAYIDNDTQTVHMPSLNEDCATWDDVKHIKNKLLQEV